jgi:hypothetical protein
MSLKTENSRRVAKSRPVCKDLKTKDSRDKFPQWKTGFKKT